MATTRPANPAPVGMPGALSQRTDGGPADSQPMRTLPNAQYGEAKEFSEIQSGAPMAQEAPVPSAPSGLFDATQRPDEPVTSGIASGPGAGPSPQVAPPSDPDVELVRRYLPSLRKAAVTANAPAGFKYFVRYLESYNG